MQPAMTRRFSNEFPQHSILHLRFIRRPLVQTAAIEGSRVEQDLLQRQFFKNGVPKRCHLEPFREDILKLMTLLV